MLYRIKNRQVIDYLYSNDLQSILHRYLNDNCDVVNNYDYILFVLTLLTVIPLPDNSHPPFQVTHFLHCGDPDIEDIAVKVESRWKSPKSGVCFKQIQFHKIDIKHQTLREDVPPL